MDIVWGIVLLILGLLGWVGQSIVWLWPETGVRLGLAEAEADVEPVFWADVRGEAAWDALVTWTLPVAGLLLMVGNPAWAYFGLVGGGIYLYFGGRGIFQRLSMRRRGMRIGSDQGVKVVLSFLAVWGLLPSSRSPPRSPIYRRRNREVMGPAV